MAKYCKECKREIPQDSKKNLCEHCQNKKFGKLRKVITTVGGIVLTIGSAFLFIITNGKFGGSNKS